MEPDEIINKAIEDNKPIYAIALFSGGYDSLVTTHVAMSYLKRHHPSLPRFTAHINTGIGIEETRTFVRNTCKEYKWELKEYHSPFKYEDIVLEHGFPGPASHRYMYIRLKERAIDEMVRAHKTKKRDRLLL